MFAAKSNTEFKCLNTMTAIVIFQWFLLKTVEMPLEVIYSIYRYAYRKLSTNFYVACCAERIQEIRVAEMFAWITLSDLLLEVIPYCASAFISAYSSIILRFSICLIILNRSVNLFVYMWKSTAFRRSAQKFLCCRKSWNHTPVLRQVRFARQEIINIM